MPLFRRESSASNSSSCSSCSSKSVSFGDKETVFYTYNSSDYDRSPTKESPIMAAAALGRILLTESDQAVAEDSQQDTIVERNTFANARRGIEGYAVMRQIRSHS